MGYFTGTSQGYKSLERIEAGLMKSPNSYIIETEHSAMGETTFRRFHIKKKLLHGDRLSNTKPVKIVKPPMEGLWLAQSYNLPLVDRLVTTTNLGAVQNQRL